MDRRPLCLEGIYKPMDELARIVVHTWPGITDVQVFSLKQVFYGLLLQNISFEEGYTINLKVDRMIVLLLLAPLCHMLTLRLCRR